MVVDPEITELLHRWKAGDRSALSALTSLAYEDLHAIAIGFLQSENTGITLQATGLVSELYLRLMRVKGVELIDRRHFYTFAAKLMRAILIDYARRERAVKRPGSGHVRVPLHEQMAWVDAASDEMLALNLALEELEALDERKVRVIELRYFLGCTIDEAAELLDISAATAERDLAFAKTWLYRRLTSH